MAPIKIKLSLSATGVSTQPEEPVSNNGEPSNVATSSTKKNKKHPTMVSSHDEHEIVVTPYEEPQAGPSRLPMSVSTPSRVAVEMDSTPTPSSTAVNTPTKPSKATRSTPAKGKSKAKAKPKGKRPSAIPKRLQSSAPSTPKPPLPLPMLDTPSPVPYNEGVFVKTEEGEGEGSPGVGSPATPQAYDESALQTPMSGENGSPFTGEYGTPTTAQKQSARWMKIKRPMRELGTKILADLVRRDEYDLFGEPVDLEAYPDYLKTVGGEDKMMDLGTMQNKVDNEEYPSFVEFQADLEKLVTAAKTFNPAGTVPHNAAIKLFNQGLKQIDRSRDLVLTPEPSRAGSAARWRDGSEMTAMTDDGEMPPAKSEVPPLSYIPEEMLDYPPNSSAAKLVGWNLNGGKRIYAKRITRGREKFPGKWRHWDLDGSRDVAEMDETDHLFELSKTKKGDSLRSITDWGEMRKEAWWEHEGLGGVNGQPPLPGFTIPKRVVMKEKAIGPLDVGVYPDITHEIRMQRQRSVMDERSVLLAVLDQPAKRPVAPGPSNFTNLFERPLGRMPIDYVRELQNGDSVGEAYSRSIERFIKGAIASRSKTPGIKEETQIVDQGQDQDQELWDAVHETCGSGALPITIETRSTVQSTLKSLDRLHSVLEKDLPVPVDLKWIHSKAKEAHGRAALHVLTKNTNSLDIVPIIRLPSEFHWQGVGGKDNIPVGLKWVAQRMEAHNEVVKSKLNKRKRGTSPTQVSGSPGAMGTDVKRLKVEEGSGTGTGISRDSSPLSIPPDSPTKPITPSTGTTQTQIKGDSKPLLPTTNDSPTDYEDGEQGLKRIRLELLALTKFYPLAALRKMDKASAEKLLPPNVRVLMTKP